MVKKGVKILNLSGAATKIAGLAGAAYYLSNEYGYRPNIITGISSGAILTIPIAMRKWETINYLVKNFGLSDIFDKPPVNEQNKVRLRAYFRAAIGKSSFGTQGNLKDKGVSYERYLMLVNASASIPLAVEPVRLDGKLLYDGGTRNHILGAWAIKNFEDIKESISIYARPKDYYGLVDSKWTDGNLINVFERYTNISMIEISKRDEREESILANIQDVNVKQIFIPSVIKDLYDTDTNKMNILYDLAYSEAEKIINYG